MSQINGVASLQNFAPQFGFFLSQAASVPLVPLFISPSSGSLSGLKYGSLNQHAEIPAPMLDVPFLNRSDESRHFYTESGAERDNIRTEDHPATKLRDFLPLTSLRDQHYALQSRIDDAAEKISRFRERPIQGGEDSFAKSLLASVSTQFQEMALGQLAAGVAYAAFSGMEEGMKGMPFEIASNMARRSVAGFAGSAITFFRMGYYHAAAIMFELSMFAERKFETAITSSFKRQPAAKFEIDFPRSKGTEAWMQSLRTDRTDLVEERIARGILSTCFCIKDRNTMHYMYNRALQVYMNSGNEEAAAASLMRMAWGRLQVAEDERIGIGLPAGSIAKHDWMYVGNMIDRALSIWSEHGLRSPDVISHAHNFSLMAKNFSER